MICSTTAYALVGSPSSWGCGTRAQASGREHLSHNARAARLRRVSEPGSAGLHVNDDHHRVGNVLRHQVVHVQVALARASMSDYATRNGSECGCGPPLSLGRCYTIPLRTPWLRPARLCQRDLGCTVPPISGRGDARAVNAAAHAVHLFVVAVVEEPDAGILFILLERNCGQEK